MARYSLRRFRKLWPVVLVFSVTCLLLIWWNNFQVNSNFQNLFKQQSSSKTSPNKWNQEEYIDKHGIKVVVGHYIGPSHKKVPNATDDMINVNHFDPVPRAGRNGMPVITEPKDLLRMQQYFQINRFNLLASDRIPLNRTLPDVRRKLCKNLYEDFSNYPTASVIIVFHNEAWSTLLRTVWSVILRSPRELLTEILLVDDASDREYLKTNLTKYVATLPVPTQVLRNLDRVGLVGARLQGAKVARGASLVFLDAHCECTVGWLEALLAQIASDRKTIACPVIDIINDSTFAYVKSFELHWGALNWQLQFRWFTLGGRELSRRRMDITDPFHTPTMAGGLFAINRDYFYELGAYDEGMRIWGGENLELSFRAWQCGGQIVIVPCSHVGHLFRKSSPYTFPGGIMNTLHANLARVALVWMDDWAEFFFRFNPQAQRVRHEQDVTQRQALRQKLKCHNFEWYLDNVWPEHFFPKRDRFFGYIRNLATKNKCLIKPMPGVSASGISNQPMGAAKLVPCPDFLDDGSESFAKSLPAMFVMTPTGYIMTDDSVCLDAPERTASDELMKVRIMSCSEMARQTWRYNNETREIIHKSNEYCLDISTAKLYDGLVIRECNGSASQRWQLVSVSWSKV